MVRPQTLRGVDGKRSHPPPAGRTSAALCGKTQPPTPNRPHIPSVVRENAATHPQPPAHPQRCAGKRSHPPPTARTSAALCGKTQPPTPNRPHIPSVVRENAATHPQPPAHPQRCAGKRSHPPPAARTSAALCGNAATHPQPPAHPQRCAGNAATHPQPPGQARTSAAEPQAARLYSRPVAMWVGWIEFDLLLGAVASLKEKRSTRTPAGRRPEARVRGQRRGGGSPRSASPGRRGRGRRQRRSRSRSCCAGHGRAVRRGTTGARAAVRATGGSELRGLTAGRPEDGSASAHGVFVRWDDVRIWVR